MVIFRFKVTYVTIILKKTSDLQTILISWATAKTYARWGENFLKRGGVFHGLTVRVSFYVGNLIFINQDFLTLGLLDLW